MGSCTPNFKFAPLAILELLAFNAQKIKGHVTLTPPPFDEFFSGVIIIIIINVIYMAQIRRMQQMRHVDCYRR